MSDSKGPIPLEQSRAERELARKYRLPEGVAAKLSLENDAREYEAVIMDSHESTVLLRVSKELAPQDPSVQIKLEFGHLKHYWVVMAKPLAYYELWWFIEQPDPSTWHKIQRRRFVRIHYDSTVIAIPELTPGQPMQSVRLHLKDLSAVGCKALCQTLIETKFIQMVLVLPGIGTIPMKARIMRTVPVEGEGYLYGLDFYHPQPHLRDQMARFVIDSIQQSIEKGLDISC